MGAIAAVIIRREKELVARFTEAGATSADRAKGLASMQVDAESLVFRRLRERAVLREAPNGGWYLDEPSWAAVSGMRRRMILLFLTLALLGIAAAWYTASKATQ